jgi:hypothetical protein
VSSDAAAAFVHFFADAPAAQADTGFTDSGSATNAYRARTLRIDHFPTTLRWPGLLAAADQRGL